MSEEWMKRRLCVWHPKSTDEHLLSSNRDYFWMDMETYHISAGTNFNADDIRRIAWDMLDNCERPDRDDVRILVGIEIVQILRMIDIYTDGVDDSLGHDCWYIDGIYFVYDKDLSALELKLQKKCMFKYHAT